MPRPRETQDPETMRRIKVANAKLMAREPFFGSLLHRLPDVMTDDLETAGTDGARIYWCPEFVATLTDEQLVTVKAHEIAHAAFLHPQRLGNRPDHDRANRAADYAANLILADAHFAPIPDWLHDSQYRGQSAEQIYERLGDRDRTEQQSASAGDGDDELDAELDRFANPTDDDGDQDDDQYDDSDDSETGEGDADDQGDDDSDDATEPGSGSGPDQPTAEKPRRLLGDDVLPAADDAHPADMEQAVMEAALIAKAAGNLPGAVADFLGELLNPRLDWREQLARFAESHGGRANYSYRRPSRRSQPGTYLPSLCSGDDPGRLLIALDTSGSCTPYIGLFLAECEAIMAEFPNLDADVVACDWTLSGPWTLADVPRRFQWGGGTSFYPVFEHAIKDGGYRGLVYLTDGYTGWSDLQKCATANVDTLWIITNLERYEPGFGEVARLDTTDL